MLKKDNVYARSDEKYTKTTLLYADSSKVLFYDAAAKTDKVLNEDLPNLFLKGVTIVDGGNYYKPASYSSAGIVVNSGTSTVTGATYTGSEADED